MLCLHTYFVIYKHTKQHTHVNNSINNSTHLKTILYFHNLVNISSNAKKRCLKRC